MNRTTAFLALAATLFVAALTLAVGYTPRPASPVTSPIHAGRRRRDPDRAAQTAGEDIPQ